jgi:hypothetical protein
LEQRIHPVSLDHKRFASREIGLHVLFAKLMFALNVEMASLARSAVSRAFNAIWRSIASLPPRDEPVIKSMINLLPEVQVQV